MTITPEHICDTIGSYVDQHPEDKAGLAVVLALLDQGADVTSRKEFRGHATAGVVLVDNDGRALFIRHVALGRWLTPGGHLEPEDSTLSGAALRELTEETGIPAESVALAYPEPVHIDVHPIPANPNKGEPDHQHFDFRYVFRLLDGAAVTLQEEEVSGYTWGPLDRIPDETFRSRVREALR
ncbi:NUDIX hydrolase [Kitasatospora sp. NPDC094016]|uniref:NUDIX hydrolase n=1 Tax=Kitasatospora sp. NPDC094016 TaxID=3154986 RepID=UPI00332F9DD1